MNANTKADPALFRHLLIYRRNSFLDTERTLERIDSAREFGKYAIASSVRDAAAMLRDQAIHYIAVRREQAKGAALVNVHQSGIAGYIGAEDGRKASVDYGGSFVHPVQT